MKKSEISNNANNNMKETKNKIDLIFEAVEKNGKLLELEQVAILIMELTEEQKKELVVSYDDLNCEKPRIRVLGKSWFAEYISSEYGFKYTQKDALHNFVNDGNYTYELFDEYHELRKIGCWFTLDKAYFDKILGLLVEGEF